jgi:hypothetical protein
MKKTIMIAASIVLAVLPTYSQGIMLSAGDTYTYQFSTMSVVGPYFPEGPMPPFGMLDGYFASFVPGSSILCEMFEDSTNEVTIAAQILSSPTSPLFPPPPGPALEASGAWQDFQGAVRFTMLSGSVTISVFRVAAVTGDSTGFVEYGTTVVPEPCALPFFCAFAGAVTLWRARMKWLMCCPARGL